MLNTIYTDREYLEQGFTVEELPLIKTHDELHNKWQTQGGLSHSEWLAYYEIQEMLGL